ncbi:F0F1 ATP synthase subunit A [Bacteroides sp.]|uniref:F0F1 ATP synthase subunit A n=1 Tax=Bacteroides sp. TaxID=29523 RepID=UPI0023BE266F|nr:F0F1 ATP synthase subunit A [Bacteroides sp.]MDE5761090.1 F0F1 ATP synthase subunit A [Bacteroides sp.]MDE6214856.1 F0F1 ATP synthase subunit A [Bacteroides sp.]
MRKLRNIVTGLLLTGVLTASAADFQATADSASIELQTASAKEEQETVNVKEIVFGHIGDSYEWHITSWGDTHLIIPLPVILYSSATGWHAFLSSRLEENGGSYEGFSIASEGSRYEGKLVEHDAAGNEVRPFDISITKVTLALLMNSVLLLVLILGVARWYRKHPQHTTVPGGFVGLMEMFVMMVNDDVIKSCIGPNYRKFAPYLLTAFFFIFINNLMGLVPFFPGGANVTGNIAITMFLALCTFIAVNVFGTKAYWKDIFWPDVPWWLKVPVPMMPMIELLGIFTKPFALMIRLFANMLAGHMAMLVLTCLIFITASMGPALNGSLTFASVLFNIFMNALELLVAFIQAYVFTMLSAVFIGLAQENGHEESEGKEANIRIAQLENKK